MDPERARAELRRLLAELPEDRRDVWRGTLDSVADAYAECRTARAEMTAQVADLRAAADLATGVSDAIRDSVATIGEATAVIRDARVELSHRIQVPDVATLARIGGAVAAVVSPIAAAVAYFASGGTVGALPVSAP
jgi:VIT1/CCC1 family predicted Fe2+/Mn2+ transporter